MDHAVKPIALAGEEGWRLDMGFAQRTRQTNPLGGCRWMLTPGRRMRRFNPGEMEDPLADAALESKALEDEPDAAFAATMESDGESSETMEMAELPNGALD